MKDKDHLDDAKKILLSLGLPRGQQNDRSAFCLLALLNLRPDRTWARAQNPLMGITPIMDWIREHYEKKYAPNTRETFRRQTMHQFVDAGIALYNPDKPDRPVNSPAAVYRIERRQQLVPVQIAPGQKIALSPGGHSELIRAVIEDFGARFVPGGVLIYAGDTGEKWGYFDAVLLAKLGVSVDAHGKMPDVVLYYPERKWLLLIESVTSHGPVGGKRHAELARLFAKATSGLVYVTAFPSRATMSRYLGDIAWETEVWVADAPSHLIHFNGERFLGPYPAPDEIIQT